jgi:hypothetical protein
VAIPSDKEVEGSLTDGMIESLLKEVDFKASSEVAAQILESFKGGPRPDVFETLPLAMQIELVDDALQVASKGTDQVLIAALTLYLCDKDPSNAASSADCSSRAPSLDPVEVGASDSVPVEAGASGSVPVEAGASDSVPVEAGASDSGPVEAESANARASEAKVDARYSSKGHAKAKSMPIEKHMAGKVNQGNGRSALMLSHSADPASSVASSMPLSMVAAVVAAVAAAVVAVAKTAPKPVPENEALLSRVADELPVPALL